MTDKMEKAKETVRDWLKSKDDYPEVFHGFFFQWTLLNLYYNALSAENEEVNRILELGRECEKLFSDVENYALALIKTECVGKGKGDAPPDSWVKTASLQLREALNIDLNSICVHCRKEKRRACEKIKIERYRFGKMEALMRILYQVRCNLFHGDKTEYKNGEQAKRNRFLVDIGNGVLEKILYSIVKN